MKLIKLSAIASTNTFLKELAKNSSIENFTVVVTNNQTNGRGQQNNQWQSKPFKNLTFSVFIRFNNLLITEKKYLNFAISLAIFKVLSDENLPQLYIKWPNDILSANQKLCGILIENSIKSNKIENSIIGIGLNVNQTKFTPELKSATSLQLATKKTYDLEPLLHKIIIAIKEEITLVNLYKFDALEQDYIRFLYRINKPSMFKDAKNTLFMGIITGISADGNLLVTLEDDSIKEFGLKEISFV